MQALAPSSWQVVTGTPEVSNGKSASSEAGQQGGRAGGVRGSGLAYQGYATLWLAAGVPRIGG